MVAPAILLDRRMTSRALLGVGRNPVGRLRVILTFLEPLLHQHARRRLMVVERAAKAKVMLTRTLY